MMLLEHGKDIVVTVCSQDPNNKAFLANGIQKFNWWPLFAMQTCDEMVTYFYDAITDVIDQHLLLLTIRWHTTK